jgi:hypothetical protein
VSLKDSLSFKGSVATQTIRNQHVKTVEFSEGFLENSIDTEEFLKHVNYPINVHFVLEEEILIPIFRPVLREFLEMEKPIRIIQ